MPTARKFLPITAAAGQRTFVCGCPRFSARASMTRRVLEKTLYSKVVAFLAPKKGYGRQLRKDVRFCVFNSFLPVLACFCASLCRLSCQNGQKKEQICTEPCKNTPKKLLCTTHFSYRRAQESRTKNQPKEEVFGTDIPRASGGHSRGYPDRKLRSGRPKSWKNKHLGADIHDPKARTQGYGYNPFCSHSSRCLAVLV